ncbi:MAG: tetraacyldisaccharide 4'-kinase [Endomicrobiia bacterium]
MESLIKIVLSFIYGFFVRFRFFLYKSKILKKKTLPVKVICIGNITAGGTGKTSAVIYFAKYLSSKNFKVAVLSRGYKRKETTKKIPVIVSDGKSILTSVEYSGDEPYLVAENLLGVPVIVCSNRYLAGKIAIEKFATDILLMDDGFQHWKLNRNLDIVLIDCLNPFSNGFLLPAGLLREPLSSLNRADIFILTNSNFVSDEEKNRIVSKIKRYNETAPIYFAFHKPLYFVRLSSGEMLDLSFVKDKEIISLSSIGNPISFEKTLETIGAIISKRIRFPDHHWFTIDEIIKILENNIYIVTTEKDAVRIKNLFIEKKDILEMIIF